MIFIKCDQHTITDTACKPPRSRVLASTGLGQLTKLAQLRVKGLTVTQLHTICEHLQKADTQHWAINSWVHDSAVSNPTPMRYS